MKKRVVIHVVVFMLLSLIMVPVEAQNYKTGIGARLGTFSGFTVKHFVSYKNALEGLITFRWNGTAITGLYEWQNPVKGAKNLDWEIGLGGHVGFFDNTYWRDNRYYNSETVVGFDFILGLEYTFDEAPFTIGLDWKPAINFVGYDHWWGDGVALSIRYNLK